MVAPVQVIVDNWVGFLNKWSLKFVHGCPCNWWLGRGSYLFPCLVRIGLIIWNVNTGDVAIDFIISTKYMKSVLPINCSKRGHLTSLHKMNSNLNVTKKDHVWGKWKMPVALFGKSLKNIGYAEECFGRLDEMMDGHWTFWVKIFWW